MSNVNNDSNKDDPNNVPVTITTVVGTAAPVLKPPSPGTTMKVQSVSIPTTTPISNSTTSQPSVTSMVTISTPGDTPTSSSTSYLIDEGPTCAKYDDMLPDCTKICSLNDLECGLCFEGGCVEKSAVVESFDCIEKDNQKERSPMMYIIMMPFLPLALGYLFLKWVMCNLGPCLLIPFIFQTLFVILVNIMRGILQKMSMIASWICKYIVYLPFAMGYHQVVLPTITFICENVVTPICTGLCTLVTLMNDYIFTPVYVGITTCLQFIWDGIVWVFSQIANATNWIYESLLVPCCTALSNFFVAVWNGITACCTAISQFIHNYIFVPINTCLSYIASSIMSCLQSIGNFMYVYIWLSLVSCFNALVEYVAKPIYNAFVACYQAFGRCLNAIWETVFVPIGNAFYVCVEAVFNGVCFFFKMIWDYLFVPIGTVFVMIFTGIGNILSAIFQGISACMNAIFENVFVPIGNAIGAVFTAIGNAIGAVFTAIANVMFAIFGALGNFLAAIWNAFTSILP